MNRLLREVRRREKYGRRILEEVKKTGEKGYITFWNLKDVGVFLQQYQRAIQELKKSKPGQPLPSWLWKFLLDKGIVKNG